MNQKLNILFLGNAIDKNFMQAPHQANWINFIKGKLEFDNIEIGEPSNNKYDLVVVSNTVNQTLNVECVEGNLLAIMNEPGENIAFHPYMFKNLDQFDQVYSPVIQSQNTIQSIPYLAWYLSLNYQELLQLKVKTKTKKISCIMSNLTSIQGHKKRLSFMQNHLQMSNIPIDFYGKGINFVAKKEDALLDYQYSIAVENSFKPYYFTEKLIDCFLTYTVPIYYGCPNLDQYFPKESYLTIDIDKPKQSMQKIKEIIENDDYKSRLPYLEEARNLVFNKYNMADFITSIKPQIYSNIQKNKTKIYCIKPIKPFRAKFKIVFKILSFIKRKITLLIT